MSVAHVLLTMVSVATIAEAQPATRALAGSAGELSHAFTEISAIRELPDGRVVVLDRREARLFLADLRAGTVRQISRTGAGPREYTTPTFLLALPEGRSAVRDESLERLLLLGSDGAPVGTLDIVAAGRTPNVHASAARFVPAATDASGRYYHMTRPLRFLPNGTTARVDSAAIERLDITANRRDTAGFFPVEPVAAARRIPGSDLAVRPSDRVRAFHTEVQWAVAPDGRVAVVSAEPYRVTFFERGRRLEGPVIPYEPVRVTERDRAAWRARQAALQAVLVRDEGGANERRLMARGPAAGRPVDFPAQLPPFLTGALSFAPDGRLWVKRATSANAPAAYDVIDRDGRVVERVTLPGDSRIVGFGVRAVYVVRVDEDELEYLGRYGWTP